MKREHIMSYDHILGFKNCVQFKLDLFHDALKPRRHLAFGQSARQTLLGRVRRGE